MAHREFYKDKSGYTIGLAGMQQISEYYQTYCIYEYLLEDERTKGMHDDAIWCWARNVFNRKQKLDNGDVEAQIIDELYEELFK